MKRLCLILSLAGLGGALLVPASAPAATYSWWVGCDDTTVSPPSHECLTTDYPAAYFEADEFTEYEVCVDFPGQPFLICTPPQEAEAGILYLNSITSSDTGRHEAIWFFAETEEVIGTWEFFISEPPSPPPPSPAPAPPAPAPPAPSTVTPTKPAGDKACRTARRRVKKARRQLRGAKGRKRKARLRAKLRRSRKSARRACRR